jgi:hypothetical protein
MTTLTGKSCWALLAQVLPCYVAGVLSLSRLGRDVLEVGISSTLFLFSILRLKPCNRIQNQNYNKV